MKARAKTHTEPLKWRKYVSSGLQLNLTKLVDDAVAALGEIRNNGTGRQRGRSRGVIFRSFKDVCLAGGYTEIMAHNTWRDQVVALDELNANAEE